MYPTGTTGRANHGQVKAWMPLELNLRCKHAGLPTQLHANATYAVVWEPPGQAESSSVSVWLQDS